MATPNALQHLERLSPTARRLLAAAIDVAAIIVPAALVAVVVAERFTVVGEVDGRPLFGAADQARIDEIDEGFNRAIRLGDSLLALSGGRLWFCLVVVVALAAAVFILAPWRLDGRTPGKLALGLADEDPDDPAELIHPDEVLYALDPANAELPARLREAAEAAEAASEAEDTAAGTPPPPALAGGPTGSPSTAEAADPADQATGDDATGDDATEDDATEHDGTGDDATGDDATEDEAARTHDAVLDCPLGDRVDQERAETATAGTGTVGGIAGLPADRFVTLAGVSAGGSGPAMAESTTSGSASRAASGGEAAAGGGLRTALADPGDYLAWDRNPAPDVLDADGEARPPGRRSTDGLLDPGYHLPDEGDGDAPVWSDHWSAWLYWDAGSRRWFRHDVAEDRWRPID